ncbi:MAG: hypothetical protein ABI570_03710 [Ilumatobacteraceae bacterium]
MDSVWDPVVGQDRAVERLIQLSRNPVHAYLFVGPEGCGKEEAARAFATLLITGKDDSSSRQAKLIARGAFADVSEVLREGAAVDKDEADNIVRQAATTPTESPVKVVIVHEVHLMRDSAAVRLLKTIEEPTPTMIFILLADQIVPLLSTITSRCVVLNFVRPDDATIISELRKIGVSSKDAQAIARAANGNIQRARMLVSDKWLAERQQAFSDVPYQLDGTGATVARVVDELLEHIDTASEPLLTEHANELEELEQRVALTGERGSGRKTLQDRHKRQARKFKSDELRSGLSAIAATYHSFVTSLDSYPDTGKYSEAIGRIHKAMGALALNANETLLLQSLFLQLPSLMMMARVAPVN